MSPTWHMKLKLIPILVVPRYSPQIGKIPIHIPNWYFQMDIPTQHQKLYIGDNKFLVIEKDTGISIDSFLLSFPPAFNYYGLGGRSEVVNVYLHTPNKAILRKLLFVFWHHTNSVDGLLQYKPWEGSAGQSFLHISLSHCPDIVSNLWLSGHPIALVVLLIDESTKWLRIKMVSLSNVVFWWTEHNKKRWWHANEKVQGFKCDFKSTATHNYLLADFTHVTCEQRGDGTVVTQESGYCPERSWSMEERGPPWMPTAICCGGCICPPRTFIINCANHLRVVGSSCNHPHISHKNLTLKKPCLEIYYLITIFPHHTSKCSKDNTRMHRGSKISEGVNFLM